MSKDNRVKLILSTIVLSGLPILSYGSVCDSKNTVQKLLVQSGKYSEESYFDCRALPHQKGYSMLAIAQSVPDQNDEYVGEYFIHLLKVNDQTGRVVSQWRDPEAYTSDAIRFTGIKLDTAAYLLQANTRAIGVRFDYSGSSRVSPYSFTQLNLYDFENKKRLLNGLQVDLYRGENDGRCNSEWEEHKGTLQMLNTKTQAYADIRVNIKIKSEGMKETKNDCIDLDAKYNQVSFVMKFDGKAYQIPKPFKEIYSY